MECFTVKSLVCWRMIGLFVLVACDCFYCNCLFLMFYLLLIALRCVFLH
jgi:hypothetical protein